MKFRAFLLALWGMFVSAGWEIRGAGNETWIEVRSPNFIVISNAAAKQARRAADRLEQFRNVLMVTMPNLKANPGVPPRIFAARDLTSYKRLVPKDLQKKGDSLPSGFFQAGQERNFVVLRLDLPSEQGYHTIYHEYVHMVMRLSFRSLPLWISEGFADFFGQATLSDSESGIGRPSQDQIDTLQQKQLIPFDILMAADHDSPYYRRQDKTRLFYAQSWALTHYLMLADKRSHVKQLIAYLDLIFANVPQAEAASRAFGDLKVLQRNLEEYIRSMGFYYYRVATKLKAQDDQYPVRNMGNAEFLAARGDLMAHTGEIEEALSSLEQALQLDPRSVTAYEALGMISLRRQDPAKAAQHFTTAANLGSTSSLTQFYAAQNAYRQGGAAQLAKAEGYLRKVMEIDPRHVPALAMLSGILLRSQEKHQEALDVAKRLAAIEPGVINHQILVGEILIAMGNLDEAGSLGRRLAEGKHSESDMARIESFLGRVQSRKNLLLERERQAEEWRARTREAPPRPKEEPPPAKTNTQPPPKSNPTQTAQSGPTFKLEGVARAVKCSSPAVMDLVLATVGREVRLRARNHYQVQYWAVDSAGKNDFQPCTELLGKKVQVEYSMALGQPFVGWILAVWVEK